MPHRLRHFFATEMLERGAGLEVVGRIPGHTGIGITADTYRHLRTGEMPCLFFIANGTIQAKVQLLEPVADLCYSR